MPENQIEAGLARSPRCQFATGQSTKVCIERYEDSVTSVEDTLVDLSDSGARLRTTECLALGEIVRVHFIVDDLGLEVDVAAEICWHQPAKDGSTLLGCSFAPELPAGTLERLVEAGHLERRDEQRHQVNCPAVGSWELGASDVSVTLRDYSRGGFCVLVAEPGEICQRLLVNVDGGNANGTPIMGRAQWQVKVEDGYLVGCVFLGGRDFGRLHKFARSAGSNRRG